MLRTMVLFWIVMLSFVPAVFAEVSHVAVLDFTGVKMDDAFLSKLSDQSRAAAVTTLPKSAYLIMTRENMMEILSDMGRDASCIKGQCEVETGRNIGADIIVTGDVLRIDSTYVLTLKMYDTHSAALLHSLDVEAKELLELKRQTLTGSQVLFAEGLKPIVDNKLTNQGLYTEAGQLSMTPTFSVQDVEESNKQAQQITVLEQEVTRYLDMLESEVRLTAHEQWNNVDFVQLRQNNPHMAVESVVRFIDAYTNKLVEYPERTAVPLRVSPTRHLSIQEVDQAEAWLTETFSTKMNECNYVPKQCTILGYDYSTGTDGKVVNWALAFELFEFSCDCGYALGCARLGQLYEKGRGLPKNIQRATELYTQACYAGNGLGCNNLAGFYKKGTGVSKNLAQAAKLYQDACTFGFASGCTSLGRMYHKGLGVSQNEAQAIQYYQKGCDGGHNKGCALLKGIASE